MKLNINLVKMEIIYLVVSFLAVIFISTNYLISLIYLLVSSGLFYFVYNLKSKWIFIEVIYFLKRITLKV